MSDAADADGDSSGETEAERDSDGDTATDLLGVESINVDEITAYQRNPKNNDDAVDLLKESIPKFGFRVPVVLDADNEIVAGHARVRAVRELQDGLGDAIEDARENDNADLAENLAAVNDGDVWAVDAGGLTPDEIREFRITDNRVQELSRWDTDKLQFELREIEEAVGFDNSEIENIIAPDDTPTVTSDDIDDATEELESHYKELADDKSDRKSKLPCPHCDSWIHVDVDELQRALKREGVLTEDGERA